MKHYLRLILFTLFAVATLASGGALHAQSSATEGDELFLLVKDDSFNFQTKSTSNQEVRPVAMLNTFGRKVVRVLADEKTYVLTATSREEADNLKTEVLKIHPEAEFEIVDSEKFKSENPELFKKPETTKKNK